MKKISDDDVFFNIQQVAKIVGVVPATIRNWEKHGIFTARRTESNYRVFNFDDIAALKRIKQYSVDEKIGTKAIKMLVEPHFYDKDEDIHYSKKLLSGKWKESREKLGLTLEDVSEKTGISPSYLSKIENAQVSISLSILQKLANFYRQSILHYFDMDFSESHVVRSGTGELIDIGLDGVKITSQIAVRDHLLYPVIYNVEPGCGNPELHSHVGEEFLHILKGRVEVILEQNDRYVLKPGDSMFFNSSITHSWYNSGNKSAEILWIHSPITR